MCICWDNTYIFPTVPIALNHIFMQFHANLGNHMIWTKTTGAKGVKIQEAWKCFKRSKYISCDYSFTFPTGPTKLNHLFMQKYSNLCKVNGFIVYCVDGMGILDIKEIHHQTFLRLIYTFIYNQKSNLIFSKGPRKFNGFFLQIYASSCK